MQSSTFSRVVACRAQPRATMTKRIEAPDLEQLRECHDKIQIRQAQLAVTRAEFELTLTKMFVKHQVSMTGSTLCLNCGRFNSKQTPCECSQE